MNTKLLATLAIASSLAIGAQARLDRDGPGERPDADTVIAEIFANHDANEDNLLNADELAASIDAFHAQMEERRAAQLEKRAERADGRERPERPDLDRPETSEIAAHLIERFDADGNGALDTEEARGAVRAIHHKRGHGHGPANGKRGPRPGDLE